ncbi:DUF262 domain-containing protein [Pseudidiomarina halophila]|nr:DUF262 domain-containing protein [Pseudidiomarina halophila]
MLLEPLNPDIRSVLAQLEDEIDLDPEFQRGDVWNVKKQQLLIDTIMRNWKIPPIFLILNENTFQKEVLDGHQRLRAIQSFYYDKIKFNGELEPFDSELRKLNGMTFSQLPKEFQLRFLRFSLTFYEIRDYNESEPFELFYRLNQNAQLTSAERRNTFFGRPRSTTKELVEQMDRQGFKSETIGFNNTRLAYHDVIARLLITLERSSLSKKLNDS